jgi:2'-5' RNA ligase
MSLNLHPNHNSLRVFLGVELPSGLRQKLADLQNQLRGTLPKVNWVRSESIHLTLKFLGIVASGMVDQIVPAIEPIRNNQLPLTLELQGLGVFPHIRRPRILWIGCTGDTPALLNLVSGIERALEPLGFSPEEKPYSPHLTLARVKRDNSMVGRVMSHSGLLDQPRNLGSFFIDRITLFRSDLSPLGAEYTALWTIPFE